MKTKKMLLILVLLTASFACSSTVSLPVDAGEGSTISLPNHGVSPVITRVNTVEVIVIAWVVNIRDKQGVPTGEYLYKADTVDVKLDGSWAYIVGGEYDGMKIFRGCTSAAGDLGCESK